MRGEPVGRELMRSQIAEARMWALVIVQLDDRTPTGPKFGRFGTAGTLGLGVT